RATRTSSSVLLAGETGTGKELFAQSIHNGSQRSGAPFISQTCAALPDSLVESILFGTKKGAFTGAIDQPGLFEQAQGGTLLLDEINSLNLSLQAKLLRALQEKKIRR
ncbi:sigma 54-interacting transcriptional regulator, partial [Bacillus velezensis]|uniref:sigma 54-interacting transcriptional regulator n=1 Tax=Bacillus velezensis TaxID=492670 RepID=UPI000CBF818D